MKIEILFRDEKGDVVYAENAWDEVTAEDAVARGFRFLKKKHPKLLEVKKVKEF